MKEYELFDEYLKVSKTIRDFCDDREKMMFECLRMDLSNDAKIHWLESVSYELKRVNAYIVRLTNERKSHFNLPK
jgi:hypothetical protein